MIRCARRALLLVLVLAVLALPGAAWADDEEMMTLTVDNIALEYGGFATLEVDLTAILVATLAESERGLFKFNLLDGKVNVFEAIAAIEDGNTRMYMQNQSTGLSHVVQVPTEGETLYIGPYFYGGIGGYSYQMDDGVLIDKFADPEAMRAIQDGMLKVIGDSMGLKLVGTEQIELFGETIAAEHVAVSMEGEKLYDLLDELAAVDADIKVYWDGILSTMYSMYAYDMDDFLSEDDEPVSLKQIAEMAGVELGVNVDIWTAQAGQTRVALELIVDDGREALTTGFIVDQEQAEGYQHVLVRMVNGEADGVDRSALYVEFEDEQLDGAHSTSVAMDIVLAISDEEGSVHVDVTALQTEAAGDDNARDEVTIDIGYIDSIADSNVVITYLGENFMEDGQMAYEGEVRAEVYEGEASLGAASFDTHAKMGTLPDGELMPFIDADTLDLEDADEDQWAELESSAMSVYNSTMVLLSRVPGLDMIMGGEGVAG